MADHGAGAQIIDARPLRAFATGHPASALSIPLRPAFATWLGWLDTHGERAMTAASLLARAGHHQLAVLDGGPESWAAATGISLQVGS